MTQFPGDYSEPNERNEGGKRQNGTKLSSGNRINREQKTRRQGGVQVQFGGGFLSQNSQPDVTDNRDNPDYPKDNLEHVVKISERRSDFGVIGNQPHEKTDTVSKAERAPHALVGRNNADFNAHDRDEQGLVNRGADAEEENG